MISLKIIFVIILTHWVADFIFQDEKWALGKSKNIFDLLDHTFVYSFIFGLVMCFFLGDVNVYYPTLFAIITLILHTITDYFTSRLVSKKFEKKEYGSSIPNIGAFTYIGFDQLLHYIQLFGTYYILNNN